MEITWTGFERPSGYQRHECGQQAHLSGESWCQRCGAHFRFTQVIPDEALEAVDYAVNHYTGAMKEQNSKLAAEAHAARQAGDKLRAKIAGLFEHLKHGELEHQEWLKTALAEYFRD